LDGIGMAWKYPHVHKNNSRKTEK
jgi:hypothetical protein